MRLLLTLTLATGIVFGQKVSTRELIDLAQVRAASLESALRANFTEENLTKGRWVERTT